MAHPRGESYVTDSALLNLTKSLSTGCGEDKCWSLLPLLTEKVAA